MIKSIAMTERGMTFYKMDGTILSLSPEAMPGIDGIMKMMQNIQLNGCTELLGLNTENLMAIISEMGFEPVEQEGGIFIKLSNGPVPAEPLQDLIKHSHATGNSAALQALMDRISTIDRQHSVEDLVRFIEKAGMPLTNDGRLVAFKRVMKDDQGNNYDCHTGRVLNNVGCRVSMDISAVDPDRTKDCSYGLHVASRGYLRRFTGDTLLLILVNPEDVIAVPQYDPEKVRVCQYDIVHEFSPDQKRHILSQDKLSNDVWNVMRPFMDGTSKYCIDTLVCPEGHVSKTSEDVFTYTYGTNGVDDAYFTEVENQKTKDVENISSTIKKVKSMNKFRELYNLFKSADGWSDQKSRFADLMIYKRKQKKSWTVLGATDEEARELNKFADRVK